MSQEDQNPFHQWVDLAQPCLGSVVVFVTDEFFADKSRLICSAEPVFIPDKFDNNGKWMDGWESRRKREAGHDFCIIRLGVPGEIRGIDIDTSHFTGNHPAAASIDACVIDEEIPGPTTKWVEIQSKVTLAGNSHHYLEATSADSVTHVRLNIFPDGGVARLRIYGEVSPKWGERDLTRSLDLFALKNGGRALLCSDEHFGSMHNLNRDGRGTNMGDGWETARRRGPGNDWVILSLGHPGVVSKIEVDTAHFKGNFPDRVSLQAACVVDNDISSLERDSQFWSELLPTQKLEMDTQNCFDAEINHLGEISHVRLSMFPDGGISRLRIVGNVI